MDAAVPSIEELLALISHLRQQVKDDAVLILAQQLQLQEKDEVISMLRQSYLAAAKSAPVVEGRKMDDRRHVLISAKRGAVAPSQG